MASISGGQFHFSSGHEPVTGPGQGAGAGHLSLASIADVHQTVTGGADTAGGSAGGGSGFDTVNAPDQGGGAVSGQILGGSDVVATQTQEGGNTVVHLPDGSSITIVGSIHFDATLFH